MAVGMLSKEMRRNAGARAVWGLRRAELCGTLVAGLAEACVLAFASLFSRPVCWFWRFCRLD